MRSPRAKRAMALSVALLALAAAPAARAQGASDKAAAEALFDQAKALMRDRKFADACPKFAESLRLDAGIGTMLWLADCYEKNGQVASAWAEFREAAESASSQHDEREKVARERAERLAPKLSRLTIEVPKASEAPGLEVKRDGVGVAQPLWGTPIPVDPGEHTVRATAPNKKAWEAVVSIGAEGRSASLSVPLLADESSSVVQVPPTNAPVDAIDPHDAAKTTKPGATQRTLGLVAAGAGVVGLGVGTYFGLAAKSKLTDSNADGHCSSDSHCDSVGTQARNDAKSDATVSTVFFVVGGVSLVAGAVLFLTAPRAAPPPQAATRETALAVTPYAGPGGGGFVARGVW